MAQEAYMSFGEYVQNTPGAVLLFVLRDVKDKELERQVVPYDKLGMTTNRSYTAKFVVDELLTAKMVPGQYTLYMYVGLPKSDAKDKEELSPYDYACDLCLTEQGVKIRVRGGLNDPSLGVQMDG
ncbi:MAG: hypothetical protein NC218_01390 [Acetobacter sp.]|nr:hypothetical protein [Acetobacter sp.]